MLTITEAAASRIAQMLCANNKDLLRVGVLGGGCSGFRYAMQFEDMANVNVTDEFQGAGVVVDQMSLMYLETATLDFVNEGFKGSGFVFRNPAVKSTCGCGQSFSA